MKCSCGRPARLSNRNDRCIVCAKGVMKPRLRKRKLSNNEREQQRRMLVRNAA